MAEIQKLGLDLFPHLLQEIPDPPDALFVAGILPPRDRKYLTVVGSRRMSRYGKDACEHLIRGLAGYPIVIVSGLALGIDGIAHRAALDAKLTTIAIPGSGLDEKVLYPRLHLGIAKDILASGGALISEMEPDEPATSYSFPKRNRLMAGISHATLVIEAGAKSGTLITAKLAVEYNRELLVVPHSIFSEGGDGGHVFAKLGAAPVRSSLDILEVFGISPSLGPSALILTDEERKVFDVLMEPLSRDELIRALGMPIADANVLISSMELRGLIAESLGEVRKIS